MQPSIVLQNNDIPNVFSYDHYFYLEVPDVQTPTCRSHAYWFSCLSTHLTQGFISLLQSTGVCFLNRLSKLTIFIHISLEALRESAGAALVPVRLVDRTAALHVPASLARVHPVSVDRPLKESGTPYTNNEYNITYICNYTIIKFGNGIPCCSTFQM